MMNYYKTFKEAYSKYITKNYPNKLSEQEIPRDMLNYMSIRYNYTLENPGSFPETQDKMEHVFRGLLEFLERNNKT